MTVFDKRVEVNTVPKSLEVREMVNLGKGSYVKTEKKKVDFRRVTTTSLSMVSFIRLVCFVPKTKVSLDLDKDSGPVNSVLEN